MAKNRYSNQKRASYDKAFKYGIQNVYEKNVSHKIYNVKRRQLYNIYNINNHRLTAWEKDFLKTIITEDMVSLKQSEIIEKIIKKYGK
jgi:hypothetical protein